MCCSDDQSSGCQTHFLFNCQGSQLVGIIILISNIATSYIYILSLLAINVKGF